jgi:hypothetical protein
MKVSQLALPGAADADIPLSQKEIAWKSLQAINGIDSVKLRQRHPKQAPTQLDQSADQSDAMMSRSLVAMNIESRDPREPIPLQCHPVTRAPAPPK